MPVYEYKCNNCGKISEILQNSKSRPAPACHHCGSSNQQKMFSTFSARIKAGQSKKCHACTDFKCPHAQK